jgi:hypothetical membrane protein
MANGKDTKAGMLLLCGIIACPLFIITFIIEGAARAGYSPFRHPISSLSIGELGWIQTVNFLIAGVLLIAFSFGLKSRLIGLVGLGLLGAGVFKTDPIYGYPEDQPLLLDQFTIHGHLHDLFSILVFTCLPAACFVFRKRFIRAGEQGWAIYSATTGILMILTFILSAIGFKQLLGLVSIAGVFQRLCIILGGVWIALLALHLSRKPA